MKSKTRRRLELIAGALGAISLITGWSGATLWNLFQREVLKREVEVGSILTSDLFRAVLLIVGVLLLALVVFLLVQDRRKPQPPRGGLKSHMTGTVGPPPSQEDHPPTIDQTAKAHPPVIVQGDRPGWTAFCRDSGEDGPRGAWLFVSSQRETAKSYRCLVDVPDGHRAEVRPGGGQTALARVQYPRDFGLPLMEGQYRYRWFGYVDGNPAEMLLASGAFKLNDALQVYCDMREIRVKAIHNPLDQPAHWPTVEGSSIEVPPKQTVRGHWLIKFNERDHPELRDIADENEVYFDSPETFHWATVTFEDAEPIASTNTNPTTHRDRPEKYSVTELSAIFEAEYRDDET